VSYNHFTRPLTPNQTTILHTHSSTNIPLNIRNMVDQSEHADCKQLAYVLRCDAPELCARLEAYVETKVSINAFRQCVRLSRREPPSAVGRLPTELVDMVALSVQDKAFSLRFPEWKLVINCGEHKFRQFLYGQTSPLSDMTSLRPHQKLAEAARSNVQDKFMVREKAETTAMMKHYEFDRELHAMKIDSASRFEVLQKVAIVLTCQAAREHT